jgi:hypothetical protein
MNKLQLLNGCGLKTSNGIIINHPKIGDIDKFGEYDYSNFVQLFCASPRDMMVVLFDSGIKFNDISQFQLFRILFNSYYESISKIFEYFTGLKNPIQSEESIMFSDGEQMVIIDEKIYDEISNYLKLVTGFENKKNVTFIDDYAMEMFVEAEKEDIEFASQNEKSASMDDLIAALVLETSYTFETIFGLYMYQFNKLIRKMIKKTDYNNLMIGVYTGNIDMKKISKDKLNWLSS